MNDDRLAALFRDAAATPPEAGFDHLDVTRASQRITRRRRTALTAVAAVVVATAGTGVVVTATRDQGTLTSAASAPAEAPENSPLMGRGDTAGAAGAPLGPSRTGCFEKNDPELRAIVEQVLPEIVGASSPALTSECRLGAGRQISVNVTDKGAAGLLTVTYTASGDASPPPIGALSAPTASGGTVSIDSTATGLDGGAPYADRLSAVLAYLAPRL